MQIRRLVLYHRDGARSRSVELNPGQLNVITGVSETGKSMLIEIVDYCLGSGTHTVYDDPLTRTIGWYGLELQIGEQRVAVARMTPAPDRKTNARALLRIGDSLPEPSEMAQNTTIEALVTRLASMIGIEDTLQQSPVETGRDPVRATLRNAMAYMFQRQYEIANPKALFSGQSDTYVKNAIRDTLPYFLGAVDHDALQTRRELARRRSELSAAEARQREALRRTDEIRRRALGLLRDAAGAGLIAPEQIDSAAPETLLAELQRAAEAPAPRLAIGADLGLGRIGDRQDVVARELRQVRAERRELLAREQEIDAFALEVNEQRSRLAALELLPRTESAAIRCPFCLAEHDEPDAHLQEMAASLRALGGRLDSADRERPRLREALDRLDAREIELRQTLEQLDGELAELSRRQQAAARLRTAGEAQAFARGRLVAFLETMPHVDAPELETLAAEVADLRVTVERLSAELSADTTRTRTMTALNAVGRDMTELARHLRLRFSDGPGVRLDPVRLDVVAETDTGETRWLSEDVGAGKNWVGYHVVTLAALHRFFAARRRPVPHLLMLDQVTQAFYPPERRASSDRSSSDLSGEDRAQVLRIFETLNGVCTDLGGALQIIVTDHADFPEEWFRERVAHDWWSGEKLIPPHWVSDTASPE
jgi:hypothetical protein